MDFPLVFGAGNCEGLLTKVTRAAARSPNFDSSAALSPRKMKAKGLYHMTQLVLFDDFGNKPLPEQIADGGKDWQAFDLQWYDVDGKRYYAVQDWLRGVALTENPAQFWRELKKRAENLHKVQLSTSCLQLPYLAKDGKKYRMDFAPAETLYQIAQYMDSATGIRNKILKYLAKAGVKLDEMRISGQAAQLPYADQRLLNAKADQGVDAEAFLKVAKDGRVTRKAVTDSLKQVVFEALNGQHYSRATNATYGMFDKTAKQISDATGFKNARDGLTVEGRALLTAAEATIDRLLQNEPEKISFQRAIEIITKVAGAYRFSVEQVESLLGLDLATGKPLLPKGH